MAFSIQRLGLLLLLGTTPTLAQGANCPAGTFLKHLFGEHQPLPKEFPKSIAVANQNLDLTKGKFFYLGSGEFGSVYRFAGDHGKSIILKRYGMDEINIINDMNGMEILHEAAEGLDVHVIKYYKTNIDHIIAAEDSVGIPLTKILKSHLVPLEKEKLIQTKYEQLLKDLSKRINGSRLTEYGVGSPVLETRYATGMNNQYSYTQIQLHPGNVLVDPVTLKLTIIDPR